MGYELQTATPLSSVDDSTQVFGAASNVATVPAPFSLSRVWDYITSKFQTTGISFLKFNLGGAAIDNLAISQAQAVTYIANMDSGGTATPGSANQFGWVIHGSVTGNTAAASAYEKSVFLVEARTSDPSPNAINTRDLCAVDFRGIAASGNAKARVWPGYFESQFESGSDGFCCNEFAIRNEGGEEANVDQETSKYNIHITNLASKNATCGIKFSTTLGAKWYKGIYAHQTMFATGSGDTFIELGGTKPFCVKPTGRIGQGTLTPSVDLHTIGANSAWRIEGTSSDMTIQAQTGGIVMGSFANACPIILVTNNVERMRLSGAGDIMLAGLGNYANDAAAAAGGVQITGLYRNGSQLMIRVS